MDVDACYERPLAQRASIVKPAHYPAVGSPLGVGTWPWGRSWSGVTSRHATGCSRTTTSTTTPPRERRPVPMPPARTLPICLKATRTFDSGFVARYPSQDRRHPRTNRSRSYPRQSIRKARRTPLGPHRSRPARRRRQL